MGLGLFGVAIIAAVAYSSAGAQVVRPGPLVRFSYAAKFICGVQPLPHVKGHDQWAPQEPPVKQGNYATAVNLHNPQTSRVKILKKVVIAQPEPEQGEPTRKVDHVLIPDGAMEVDCREINKLLVDNDSSHFDPQDNQFRKGFVVVESTAELDVVAVYTANTDVTALNDPTGDATGTTLGEVQGMTMDVEYIPSRRIIGAPTVGVGG